MSIGTSLLHPYSYERIPLEIVKGAAIIVAAISAVSFAILLATPLMPIVASLITFSAISLLVALAGSILVIGLTQLAINHFKKIDCPHQ